MKKLFSILATIIVAGIIACFPAGVAAAAGGTTLEINSGSDIVMSPGDSIVATHDSGIPIEIKNLPDFQSGNGFAAFDLELTWDPAVVQFNNIESSTNALDIFIPGNPDQVNGSVLLAGLTTNFITADTIILYLGLTAVGNSGDSGSLNITVNNFLDKDNNPIPVETVPARVVIGPSESSVNVTWLAPLMTAEPYIAQCGSTIPVKFALTGANGSILTDAAPLVTVTNDGNGTVVFSGTANFNEDIPGYKINVKTKGWESGNYTISLPDYGAAYAIQVIDKGKGKLYQNREREETGYGGPASDQDIHGNNDTGAKVSWEHRNNVGPKSVKNNGNDDNEGHHGSASNNENANNGHHGNSGDR